MLSKLIKYESGERNEYRMHYIEEKFMWNFPLFYPNLRYVVKYIDKNVEKTVLLTGISENLFYLFYSPYLQYYS